MTFHSKMESALLVSAMREALDVLPDDDASWEWHRARWDRAMLLSEHIERLWRGLPEQSRRRLATLAVSAGTAVDDFEHGTLVGALGLIAEAEGTLEVEREFADAYLGVEWIARAIAEWERERVTGSDASPDARTARRREQTRLAVARHRARERERDGKKERKRREAREGRLEALVGRRAIAVDGEGVTVSADGRHLYRYLAASSSDGTVLGEVYEENGISTRQALDFIARLPKHDDEGRPYLGVFGYGLGYDESKWVEDMRDDQIYSLFHDDIEDVKVKVGRYKLVLLGKCLQVDDAKAPKGRKRTLVWDILKGFQSTFVKALRDWEVGTKEEWERIEAMKKKRGQFAKESWEEVTHYCKDECRLLAALTEKYIYAHVEAGIDLRGKYHGAGSTSDAFLTLMDAMAKRCTRDVQSEDMEAFAATKSAFSRAFFGGRAEVSRIGIVSGPIHQADVASAYPHALFDLPCVRHGKWRHVQERGVGRAVRGSRLCCVHYRYELQRERFEVRPQPRQELAKLRLDETGQVVLEGGAGSKGEDRSQLEVTVGDRMRVLGIRGGTSSLPWGPLPYRTEEGRITFPAAHPGGWAWAPEYLVAKKYFPGVRAVEAWALKSECQCERPYRAIGHYYLVRIEWGSASKGKVLKLGMNGCYGKFAQVIGKNPKYSCRVVAGQITATTRGRLVEAMASAEDPWSYVYAATDGLLATAAITPPDPPENETWSAVEALNRKGKGKRKFGLGQWEVDTHPDAIFIVQPGFYFGMKPKSKAKTRGTPLEVIDEYREKIIEQWRADPTRKPKGLPQQDVFHGAKSSVRKPTKQDPKHRRDPMYGRWTKTDRKLNYVVSPKRSDLVDQGDGSFRLLGWWLEMTEPESHEYKKDASFVEEQERDDDQPDYVEPLLKGVGKDD